MEKMLNTEEAAAILGVSVQTLNTWRCTKRYPLPYVKIGRLVKYRLSSLQAFIELRSQEVAG
jgi:predicted DNA-binding transcriptional regulator AlpA